MGLPYERTDLHRNLCCTGHRTASAPDLYVLRRPFRTHSYGSLRKIYSRDYISSITFHQLDETVAAMYPLMEPALHDLSAQICEKQSAEDVSYSEDSQYTSMMLMSTIRTALEKDEK